MTQDYDIRRAAPSDMEAILRFQRAAIAKVPERFYADEARAAWLRVPAAGLDGLIAQGRYYVAVNKEIPMAGAGWEPATALPGTAAIRGVFVHPDCKMRGIGTWIVSAVEDAAVTAGFTRILVPASLNATGFYEKLGYRPNGNGEIDLGGTRVSICKMWKDVA
jgi:GNAT superfamily N-acetyltransferase